MTRLRLSLLLLAFSSACSEPAPETDAGPLDAPRSDGGPIDAPAIDTGVGTDAPAADAPADAAAPSCTLTASGPVVIDTAGAIVELLDITSDGTPGIRITADGVIVRDVRIRHRGGPGISVDGAADVVIERVDIENVGAPATGAASTDGENDIQTYQAPRLTVRHVRLTRGSTGIYLQESPGSRLTEIEGHDFRGPFPRGQLVQWNNSDDGVLDGFSVICGADSWTEDNVNVYQSTGITIRNGLVDGNNSPSGVGVIFDDMGGGIVEDVDAVHMGNGCFSNYVGLDGNVFRRARCRDNICADQGRGPPSSNALMFAGNPDGVSFTRVEDSSYWASCNGNVYWPSPSFEVLELVEREFTPRAPLVLDFCFGR